MGVTTATAIAAATATSVIGFAAGYLTAPVPSQQAPSARDGMYLSKGGWKKKKVVDPNAPVEEYAGDAKKGAALFKAKCATCHSCVQNGPVIQGPNLYQIMGKQAAKSKGFKFTKNFAAAAKDTGEGEPLKWDNESMSRWLESPKQMVKGTSMAFPGFKKPADRADVVAYLNSIN